MCHCDPPTGGEAIPRWDRHGLRPRDDSNNLVMKLKIKVIPKAKENKIEGLMADGALKVRITAPATDNKANLAVINFLAEVYKKSKNKIKIVSGLTSRNKIIEIGD